MCPLVSNSAAREILNGNWIARLYKFRERAAPAPVIVPPPPHRPFAFTANWHPECYKRSLAIISSDVPRRISESSTTNMDRPVIARSHTFCGSYRMLCETIARHRDHLAGFAPSEYMYVTHQARDSILKLASPTSGSLSSK